MSIVANTDYSSIDATSILLMKLMSRREQRQSIAQTMFMSAPIDSIRTACGPSTSTFTASTFTGGIGNWLKDAKFNEKQQHHGRASLLVGGGLLVLRNAPTMQQQSRQSKWSFPLAATKKRALVKAHSMRTFRALWSNGASSRDQHVNREVFARKLERGTLVVKTRK
jgi:hypothetical protein